MATTHEWRSLLSGEGLAGWESAGAFARSGEKITGDDGGYGDRLMTGEDGWADYELAVALTVVKGAMAQLHYRIGEGHRCWYTLDLRVPERRISLSWADNRAGGPGLVRIVEHEFPLAYGREYDVRVSVEGAGATAFIDGAAVGKATDLKHATGRVALGLWQCKAEFRAPRIRMPGGTTP